MPFLSAIYVHPIKALDPLELRSALVLPSGALKHDREFALLDAENRFINGKRNQAVHLLRAHYDANVERVTLTFTKEGTTISARHPLEPGSRRLQRFLQEFFGFPVTLARNEQSGFPDDTDASGPTIVSTATLETVASWFPGLTVDSVRRRFRANLEISGVPAFWEDRLYGGIGQTVKFRIGQTNFEGVNPCQRCIVPTRDPLTAEPIPEFDMRFQERRQLTLPEWASRTRFNHYYRLAVNTRAASPTGSALIIGQELEIL